MVFGTMGGGKGGGSWQWVDTGGGKGGGKGKGKSKGKSYGKGKDKGKGKGKKVSTSYFFEDFPHLAKGYPVVKCKTPTCFGCCTFGDNPPCVCYECELPFDFSRFHEEERQARPANKQKQAAARDSSAGSARSDNKDHHQTKGDELVTSLVVNSKMSKEDANKHAQMIFPKWKEAQVVDKVVLQAKTSSEIKKMTEALAGLKNKLKNHQTKYEKLEKELEESAAVGTDLTNKVKQAIDAINEQERFLVTTVGTSSITHQKHAAYGGDTASSRIITNLESFINVYGAGAEVKAAASSELLDLVSSTELFISNANLEKDEALKQNAALQKQVSLLTQGYNKQVNLLTKAQQSSPTPKPKPRAKESQAQSSSHNSFAPIAEVVTISGVDEEDDQDEDPLGVKCSNLDAPSDVSINFGDFGVGYAVTPVAEDEDILNWETVMNKSKKSRTKSPQDTITIIRAQEVDAIAASTAAATPPLVMATATAAQIYDMTRWDTTS